MSLSIGEMQVETTWRFHLTPARRAFIKKLMTTDAGNNVGKEDPYKHLVRV